MLDLLFSYKIYESVMNNSQCKNKFWSYYVRQAILIAILLGVIFLILAVCINAISAIQIVVLCVLWGLVSLFMPLITYSLISKV